MCRLRNELLVTARRRIFGLAILISASLGAGSVLAQPANDNFANAISLGSSTWGSVSNDNTGATAEPNEPPHSGFTATNSIWYTWTAPQSGDVEMDTIGSSVDTVLAVYTGANLANLNQVAANDDMYPTLPFPGTGQIAQENEYGENQDSTNIPPNFPKPPGGVFDTNLPPGPVSFQGGLFLIFQPFSGVFESRTNALGNILVPGSGASELHFTAVQGVTYYIAVDSKLLLGFIPNQGPITLNWAFRPSGVFRFATEKIDQTAGVPGMLLYQVSENETLELLSGPVVANQYNTTIHTYYQYDVPGLLVTVTRVAGSSGRVNVGYSTVDGDQLSTSYDTTNGIAESNGIPVPLNGDAPAHIGIDYGEIGETGAITGTLTFDDFEMSKTIFIPIQDDGGIAEPNRDFGLVLFNPAVGTNETADISQPRLDPIYSQALVRILDVDLNPDGPSRTPIVSTNMITMTNNVTNIFTTNIVITNIFHSLDTTNEENMGPFNFTKANYRVTEDVGNYWPGVPITVYVNREGTNTAAATLHYRVNNFFLDDAGPDQQNEEFPLEPGSDYALPAGTPSVGGIFNPVNTPQDFDCVASGTISFPSGNRAFDPQPITFTVFNTNRVAFNRDFQIDLYSIDSKGGIHQPGMVAQATVTILFDDSNAPAGSIDEWYNPDFSLNMVPAQPEEPLSQPGTDQSGQVNAVAVLTNNESIIAGLFSTYNGTPRHGIAMVQTNGQLDTSFDPGDGISIVGGEFFSALAVETNGQILAVGNFASYNGNPANNIVRINGDGSIDAAFEAATDGGANGTIRAIILRSDGTIVIGGDFTTYSGTPRNHVALLNSDGSLNMGYDPGTALNGAVYAITQPYTEDANGNMLLSNAPVVVGGDFTSAGGIIGQDHIARLGTDGTIDLGFDPSGGANARVRALITMTNGQIIAGGDFTVFNNQNENYIVRLNTNGSVDTQFFSGTGTDAPVYHLNHAGATTVLYGPIIATNSETIYVGGPFTVYNGTHRLGFARLNSDGSLDTTFLDTAYNQFAGFPRVRLSDPPNAVYASALQSDGNIIVGGTFHEVGGGQFDPFDVRPDSTDPGEWPEPKARNGVRNRNNVARLVGGATPGPGNLSLVGDNGGNYSANKSQSFEFVRLSRQNGALGPVWANFSVGPQTAEPGLDYSYFASAPFYGITWEYAGPSRQHSDAFWGTNTVLNSTFNKIFSEGQNGPASVLVNLLNPASTSGNVIGQFQLANPSGDNFYLGGQNIPVGLAFGRSVSQLTIVDDHRTAGDIGFSSPTYSGSSLVPISVVRTNGNFNTAPIQIDFATSAGSNAISGVDYRETNGILTFNNGDTNKIFSVQIIASNYISSAEKLVNLRLFNYPTNVGPALTNAVLRIINPNFQGFLNFSATNYVTNLNAGAIQFTVTRTVGSKGTLDVQYGTTNGTAVAGVNYVGVTNSLHWNDGDVSNRTVTIPLLNPGTVGGSNYFFANLFNASLNGSPQPSLLGTITNTTLVINNDNTYGIFQFSSPTYVVNEGTNEYATITVIRDTSALSNATVSFTTANGTAFAGTNYIATNGTLQFTQGQIAATFTVPILDDRRTNVFPFYFNVLLTNVSTGALLGSPTNAQVNIVDAQSFNRPPGNGDVTFNQFGIDGPVLSVALQSDKKIIAGGNFLSVNGLPRNHFVRLNPDGTLDTTFLNELSGADAQVSAVAVQSDGNVLVGGSFQHVDGVARNRIARVGIDGSLDTSFNPGSGADNSVFAIAETFINGARKMYVGGAFVGFGTATFPNPASPGIQRLNNDGTPDATFTSTGVNGTVYAIAVYPTNSVFAGKVVIGGSFTTVNGVNCTNIARLNVDGSLDTNFNIGADDIVRALAIQNDDEVVLGGQFLNVDGAASTRLARLNTDGSLDTGFTANLASGFSDTVNAIALQQDNRIVVGGQFLLANGLARNHITRLMPSGVVDPTINFGDGANGNVNTLVVQPADQFILLGGAFTQYNDVPAPYLTRIYGGSATDSGAFEFTSAAYQVNENGIQALITIRRTGGLSGTNSDGSGNVSVRFTTTPGSAAPNVNYDTVVTNVSFPPAVAVATAVVPVLDDGVITSNLTVNLALSNPSADTGLGDQTNAVLTIINTDNSIAFQSGAFQVAKNNPTGVANITIIRNGGGTTTATVGFGTTTNGTAQIGLDYFPTNALVTFNPGVTQQVVQVGITNNNLPEGDRTVGLMLSNAVGSTLASPSNAVLTIKDTTFAPGQLSFAATNFFADEGSNKATITVVRTNGTSGSVSAFWYTVPGTAQPGVSYISASNTITLSDGQPSGTFDVQLVQNSLVLGTVNFGVVLTTNLGSGTTLVAPTNATVFIADDNSGFLFANATNTIVETSPQVAVTVLRTGPTNNTLQVSYATRDGTAVAGVNYTNTSGTLQFNPGETQKAVLVPIIHDPLPTGTLQFSLALSNPTPGSKLGYPATNYIEVLDADAGISFTNATMTVRRNIGNALVTVITTNPAVEPPVLNSNSPVMSVQYTTSDGTAFAGLDYVKTSGTLVFTNGNGTNTFLVPIINNSESGTRTFNVSLFNPTSPGRLVAPSNQAISIIDATAGFKFSSSRYSVNKNAGTAMINVLRTGLTTNTASVDFQATNGTAIPGVHYYPTNGTLVFTNGVTNLTFGVQVIDTSTVQPNETVLLELLNPTNGVMGVPSASTLTILDSSGGLVVPAGSQITAESGPVNDVVDSNETVTILFAFRQLPGETNVTDLVAKLLATNGVTSPSGSQDYGALISGGHSVYRPFTFTAEGTNGQQIAATFQLQFQLQNGSNGVGTGVFGYVLGSSTFNYTNSAAILINDDAIATPYPSTISVSNLIGSVLKTTITLTNMEHTSPHDIDALLVSPTEQTVLFMAHCGGQNVITNVTLTFDDDASTVLPNLGQIFSGTNKPTAYPPVQVFP